MPNPMAAKSGNRTRVPARLLAQTTTTPQLKTHIGVWVRLDELADILRQFPESSLIYVETPQGPTALTSTTSTNATGETAQVAHS